MCIFAFDHKIGKNGNLHCRLLKFNEVISLLPHFPFNASSPWGRNLFLCFLFFQMAWKTWLYFSLHFKHSQYLQQYLFWFWFFLLFTYYRGKMPNSLRPLQSTGPLESSFPHLLSLKWEHFVLSPSLFSPSSPCCLIFASFSGSAFLLTAHPILLTTPWCHLVTWHLTSLFGSCPPLCCARARPYAKPSCFLLFIDFMAIQMPMRTS